MTEETNPSRSIGSGHGYALGREIARLADNLRQPTDPDPCSTCGLKRGTLANINSLTMSDALGVIASRGKEIFGCHHGMRDGEPTRSCIQASILARRASVEDILAMLTRARVSLDDKARCDEISAYVAGWWKHHDPDQSKDNYQLGRLWERTRPHILPSGEEL